MPPGRGTASLTRQTRPIAGERFFVLGDATGYIEPFTGEGMAWAMVSGQAIAPLVRQGIKYWEPSLPRTLGIASPPARDTAGNTFAVHWRPCFTTLGLPTPLLNWLPEFPALPGS